MTHSEAYYNIALNACRAHIAARLPELALHNECDDTKYAIVFDRAELFLMQSLPSLDWPEIRQIANDVARHYTQEK